MEQDNIWGLLSKVIPFTPRVLLYGVPGTGKTYQANTLGLSKEQGVYNITLTQDSTAAELMGHYIATDSGGFEWLDGVGVRAWKEGARLVINEIDHAGVDVMTFLHALLDDPKFAKFTLPNKDKEVVRPAEGFQIVATMNGTPQDLSDALSDRFPVKIEVNEVHPDALEALPNKLKAVYQDYNYSANFSVRKWTAFAELLDKGCELEVAARAIFPDDTSNIIDAMTDLDKDE